jgi:hypothetical protein
MSADYTRFKTPGVAGDSQLTDQLRSNLHAFFDYALMQMGYFVSVTTGTFLAYGGPSPSILRLSDDTRYLPGTVWDGFKTNWVWETSTDFPSQPIQISGIYINGQFVPNGASGAYAFNISYPLGRVIFNVAVPTNTVVQVNYSYKYYNIYADTVDWFKQITYGLGRIDDPQFNMYGSGIWTTMPESRAQLPAVVIEPVPRRKWLGMGLGGGTWLYTDVLLHVFAETAPDRDNLIDIFTYQNEKRFFMFDKNQMHASGAFPLNRYGFLVNPQSIYPYLLTTYPWRSIIVRDALATALRNNPQSFYFGSARWNLEISFPEL